MLIDMASPGRRDAADQADLRRLAVLRDLLHRREGPQGEPRRPAQRRLGDRQAPAAIRAGRTSPAASAAAAARPAARPATWSRSPSATSAWTRPARWPTRTCARASPKNRMDTQAFCLTMRARGGGVAGRATGRAPPPRSSNTPAPTFAQERSELMVEAMGDQGLGWEGEGFAPGEIGRHARLAALARAIRSRAAPRRSISTWSPSACWACPTRNSAIESRD